MDKSDNKQIRRRKASSRRIDETGKRYGKLTVLSYAETRNNLAYWYCQCDCGNITTVRGNSLRMGYIKSCGCVVSYKEQEIRKILETNNISFKKEYTFEDLKDKGNLRFDFAIFVDNQLYGLIEYQGQQHFEKPDEFNHYGLLQKHDKMKIDYCKEQNIPLLILSKSDNLEQSILDWLKN